ncbi:anti-FecI sigma factor, FecR (plasmid) [Ketogulonicigenium robustum]|uniref:Anti-FecI sigma factor, FecR n=1 Tax=Ketogulonicigenium robustum TaxID=92947 RepID=A0A1W6P301_9RHOB|nr:DUF4880 domain-containing protein [Ketogulonicigenium robustum]ARO15824.1 anti-FecI sigma factor, FecR [Ketogulonicigenium robustum]
MARQDSVTVGRPAVDGGPDEASAWIALLVSGRATAQDAADLRAWQAASPENAAAYQAALRVWHDVGPALAQSGAAVGARRAVSRRAVLRGGVGLALAVGGAGVASQVLGLGPFGDGAAHVVGVGGRADLRLQDGSAVVLDGGSRMTPEMDSGARGMHLLAGAAQVQVAAEASQPFALRARDWRAIAAPGAEIAVVLGAQSDCIECLSGDLAVAGIAVPAGHRMVRSADDVYRIEAAPPEAMAAWRAGYLVFQDRPLADVVADINRHRRGRIVVMRAGADAMRVSGVFHLQRPDEILPQIKSVLGFQTITLPGLTLIT